MSRIQWKPIREILREIQTFVLTPSLYTPPNGFVYTHNRKLTIFENYKAV